MCVCLCGCNSLLASLPYLGKNRTQELRGAVGENREAMWPRGDRIPSTFSVRSPIQTGSERACMEAEPWLIALARRECTSTMVLVL